MKLNRLCFPTELNSPGGLSSLSLYMAPNSSSPPVSDLPGLPRVTVPTPPKTQGLEIKAGWEMGASPSNTSPGGKHNPTKHQHEHTPHNCPPDPAGVQAASRELRKAAALGTDYFTAKGGFTSEEHQKDPTRTTGKAWRKKTTSTERGL